MNPPPLPVRKRFPWIPYGVALVLIVLFAFAPIGSVMLCAAIANAYGCKVDEGSVHPCIIRGTQLRRASLFARCDGLVHAGYASRGPVRIRRLAHLSDSPSCQLAKTIRCRSYSSDPPAAGDSMTHRL